MATPTGYSPQQRVTNALTQGPAASSSNFTINPRTGKPYTWEDPNWAILTQGGTSWDAGSSQDGGRTANQLAPGQLQQFAMPGATTSAWSQPSQEPRPRSLSTHREQIGPTGVAAPQAVGGQDIGSVVRGLGPLDQGDATQRLTRAMQENNWSADQVGSTLGFSGQQVNDHIARYGGQTANGTTPAATPSASATGNYFAPEGFVGPDGRLIRDPSRAFAAQTSGANGPTGDFNYSPIYADDGQGVRDGSGSGGEGGASRNNLTLTGYRTADRRPGDDNTGDKRSRWNGRDYTEWDLEGNAIRNGTYSGLTDSPSTASTFAQYAAILAGAYGAGTLLGGGVAAGGAGGAATAAEQAAMNAMHSAVGSSGASAFAPAAAAVTEAATAASAATGGAVTASAAEAAAMNAMHSAVMSGTTTVAGIKGAITTALSSIGLTGRAAAGLIGAVVSQLGSRGGSGGGGGGSGGGGAGGSSDGSAGTAQGRDAANFLEQVQPYLRNDASNVAGSSNWVRGADGRFTLQNNLTGGQREIYDTASNRIQEGTNWMDPNEQMRPLIDTTRGDYSDELARTIYQRTTRNFQPQFDEQRRGLEQRLAERGMQPGNAAYNAEMTRFENQQQSQLRDAADAAQIQAAAQALQEGEFTNNSRRTQFSGNQTARNAMMESLRNTRQSTLNQTNGMLNQTNAPTGTAPNTGQLAQQQYENNAQREATEDARRNALYEALIRWGLS